MKRITIILWAIMAVVGTSVSAQTVWYDPMQAGDEPYVEGRAWNKEIGKANYSRLPDRFEGKVSKHVWTLSKHTAGMSVRFFTTAKRIKVRFINVNAGKNYPNVVSLNHSGVDLYATDVEGNTTWVPNMMKYTFSVNGSDTAQFVYDTREMPVFKRQGMYYELYLPSYNGIKWLSVGVDKNERFEFIRGSQERPIVVYGTSIAHGASASRPGLIWTTLLKRRYDIPFINLGFSGSAKMENIMYDALSEIEARAYIIDCIPNCEGLDNKEFASRVEYGIRKLREKSGAPIIFMEGNAIAGSSTHLHRNYYEQHEKDSIQYEVYMRMKALGFKNMYYITDTTDNAFITIGSVVDTYQQTYLGRTASFQFSMGKPPVDILHSVPAHTHIHYTMFTEQLLPSLPSITTRLGFSSPEMGNGIAYHEYLRLNCMVECKYFIVTSHPLITTITVLDTRSEAFHSI